MDLFYFLIPCSNLLIKLSIPIRLNCANICLDDDMFFDEHMNVILSINDNMSNFIEVSNLDLLTYIQTHYKNYRFIIK